MKYILLSITIIAAMCQFADCSKDPQPPGNFITSFPTTPVNMGASINSVYDDYNSAFVGTDDESPLCFSSNRNSNGNNFDIVYKLLAIISTPYHPFSVGEETNSNLDVYQSYKDINDALAVINSGNDELGPYLVPNANLPVASKGRILLYANNNSGNLKIKFVTNINSLQYSQPQEITYLNSLKDNAYPCFSKKNSCIYFCSNRGGDFDIYKVQLNATNTLLQNLSDTISKTVVKDTVMSSQGYDDKCPFIIGNMMVFTSNRPGGYGGFDLYYSLYTNGKWSAPVNFGNKINTAYDEYRPIVKSVEGFTNLFMIFSSNRPGGYGGFDLYYVGIDNMIHWNEATE